MSSGETVEPNGAVVASHSFKDRLPNLTWPGPVDAALTLVVVVVCLALTPLVEDDSNRDFGPVTILLTVIACAPVAFRRIVPVGAAVVSLSATLPAMAFNFPMTGPIVVALALVGLATSRAEVRKTGTLGVYSGAIMAAIALLQAEANPFLSIVSGFAVGMLPALIGEQLRSERVRTEDARELARRVEQLRDRDVERAVAEERLRIARDLHDITGHHLSAIALQAAGAGRLTPDRGAQVSFERIHGLTVEALGQTRRSLGVLRQDSGPMELAPSPRLAQVEGLFEPARGAGIDVSMRVEGEERELSETAEMCGYRVIQESLTNVVRHAEASSVRVVVAYGNETLTVTVEDDGSGGTDDGPVRAGSGIEGMRERVALVGGSIVVGPRGGGGWSVQANLPLVDH